MKRCFGFLKLFFALCIPILIWSCKGANNKPIKGEKKLAIVMADETFKPLCEQLKMVFEMDFRDSEIRMIYTSEANCFKNMTTDSIDAFITGRALTQNEMQYLKDTIGNIPNSNLVARDGLTFIVAKNSSLNSVNIKALQKMATDKMDSYLIFEGLKSTSTLRTFADSLLGGKIPVDNINGAESAEALIDKVSKDPNAVGVLGWHWIGDYNNQSQNKYRSMVKTLPVIDDRPTKPIVFAPNQLSFYDYTYPLIRGIYTITKGAPFSTGRNFAAFMANEQGQLIFRRAAIAPVVIDFSERKLKTK